MNIINIRGSHGAGKSWVVRQVMATLPEPETAFFPDGKRIEGYRWSAPPLFVVGKYIPGVSTGGCDTIKEMDDIERIVITEANIEQHVLFEGIRVNGGHDRWVQAAWKNKQHNWRFFILDTSVETSMKNIHRRMEEAGKKPGTKARESVEDHWKRCQRQREHFRRAGLKVEYLSPEAAVECTLELICLTR